MYAVFIRPVIEFCCVVYHSLLNDRQDELIDQCQAHALRCIFGKDMSYSKMSTWEKDLKKTARSYQVVDPARLLRGTSAERNYFVPDHENLSHRFIT